jgi:autotransporter-associated beta strand protein
MATDFYWSGGSGSSDNIDQGANWWSGTNPSSGDSLYFTNTPGSNRQSPYCNAGSGAWFGNIVIYNNAQSIRWRGDQTSCYAFCNDDNPALIISEATLANRTGPDTDLIMWPGGGGLQVSNVVLQNGRQLLINTPPDSASSTLWVMGTISQSGTGNATLALNAPATLILTNFAATYAGDTFINNGTLRLAVNNALANSGNYLRLGDASGSAGANLNLQGGITLSTPINVRSGSSGTKVIANTASITGTATYAGNLYLDDNATAYANSGGSAALTGSTLDLKNQTLTVDGAGTTTISGVLQNSTGSGKLTKNGSGTLTLSAANTYSGGTTISQGTLKAGSATAIPNGSGKGIVVLNPTSPDTATFDLAGQSQTINGLSSSGTGSSVVDNSSSTTKTLTIGTSGANPDTTFAGVIKNTGSSTSLALTKAGSGTLTLSGANTYGGATAIQSGKIVISGGDDRLPVGTTVNLGSSTTSGVLQLGDSTGAFNQTLAGVHVTAGTANAVVGGNASTSVLTMNDNAGLTYSGLLGGTGPNQNNLALVKAGTATTTLSGANSYTGGTTIRSGTLVWGNPTALGAATVTLNDPSTGTSATSLYRSGSDTLSVPIVVANQGSGTTTIGGGGGATYARGITLNRSVTLEADSGGARFAAGISGSGGVTVAGTGNLALNAANTFSGDTLVNTSSTLVLGDVNALQNSTLDMSGGGTVAVGSITSLTLGGLKGTGNWDVIVPLRIGNNNQDTTYSGYVRGSISLTKIGSGKLTLSGTTGSGTPYTGSTTVSQGTLEVSSGTALSGSTTLNVNGGTLSTTKANVLADTAAVTVSGGTLSLGGDDLVGSVTLTDGSITGSGSTLTATSPYDARKGSVSAKLGGSAGLNKTTADVVTLSGANAYGGNTAISAGTLALSGSGSIASSPLISVASGASFDVSGATGGSYSLAIGQTLKGTGTVNGNLVVASGAAVAPGASIGTLSFSGGSLTFSPGGTLSAEVDRNGGSPLADRIQGVGALTEGGILSVLNNGATLQVNDSFTLLSAATFSGAFSAISPASPNSDPELAWDTAALKTIGLLRVHHVPYATNKTIVRTKGMTAKIKLSELFPTTDSVDSDTVALEGFTAGSQGATISCNASYIFYVPANDNNDVFNYTVTDGRGGRRTQTITINVTGVTGQAQQITVAGGRATVIFAGIAGYSYTVERAEDPSFTVNLVTVLTTNTPNAGLFTFVDYNPPGSQGYYRLKYNP